MDESHGSNASSSSLSSTSTTNIHPPTIVNTSASNLRYRPTRTNATPASIQQQREQQQQQVRAQTIPRARTVPNPAGSSLLHALPLGSQSPRDQILFILLTMLSALLLSWSWFDLLPGASEGLSLQNTVLCFLTGACAVHLLSFGFSALFHPPQPSSPLSPRVVSEDRQLQEYVRNTRIRRQMERERQGEIGIGIGAGAGLGLRSISGREFHGGIEATAATTSASASASASASNPTSLPGILAAASTNAFFFSEHEILRMGYLATITISLHNFLEGMALALTVYKGVDSYQGFRLPSFMVLLALLLENLPEGLLTGLPIYFATRSLYKTVLCAFAAGITEVIGVFLCYLILLLVSDPDRVLWFVLSASLAVISGMISALTLLETIPWVVKNTRSRGLHSVSLLLGVGFIGAVILQPLLIHYGRVHEVE